ncbi:AlpA family phage regulatory protein [Salmonella enterica]|nr:AlpA family phage regulatory protein [Salmonella enterica]
MGEYLGMKDVVAAVELSETTVYRLIREGNFPKPAHQLQHNRKILTWPREAIEQWVLENGGLTGKAFLDMRRMANHRRYPKKYIDLRGQKFSHWTVFEWAYSRDGLAYWTCRCRCGEYRAVLAQSLKSGKSKSCGCMKKAAKKRHELYQMWLQMRGRCCIETHRLYSRYGGRGITLCGQWQDFWHFTRDVGQRPAGSILKRRDLNRGYSPENCFWKRRNERI